MFLLVTTIFNQSFSPPGSTTSTAEPKRPPSSPGAPVPGPRAAGDASRRGPRRGAPRGRTATGRWPVPTPEGGRRAVVPRPSEIQV